MKGMGDGARQAMELMWTSAGLGGSSVGELEQLAGIDTSSHAERWTLWESFSAKHTGQLEAMVADVMEECAVRTIERIARGDLAIVSREVGERAARAAAIAEMAKKWLADNGDPRFCA